MEESDSYNLSAELGRWLKMAGAQITTAESCTGGMLAGAITDIPGSSGWFTRSVVTYSNAAKQDMLNVSSELIRQHGAVSEACVLSMCEGALQAACAHVAVAVSGIAGPDGATPDKPVGTVWIGWALALPIIADKNKREQSLATSVHQLESSAECFQFSGDRLAVRHQAVIAALRGTILRIDQNGN